MNPDDLKIYSCTRLRQDEEAQLTALWDSEYPRQLNGRFTMLLDGASSHTHYLLKAASGLILGWIVAFEKDGETRFSIIVRPGNQGKGIGARLIHELKTCLDDFSGWVIDHDLDLKADGSYYLSPLSFYLKLGFDVSGNDRIDSELLSALKVRWQRNRPQTC